MDKAARRPHDGETKSGPKRCAIYTRKSTEEGLDQAFNSLDAQREACEAYIVSQRHEGWQLVPEPYDDCGISGGTMERPALQRLLADVRTGRVDVIVVYKVDRLTRALSDFAKIVDVLDAAGASFVSITQSFNTTTSMGRLTLNVLLSFAQFEREVISERVRDKIAASKAKGMWMGGTIPLGYDICDRKLVPNDAEAAIVRSIFKRYLEHKSVPALMGDLRANGIVTKRQSMRDGSKRGGIAFTRGPLYHLLKNRIYRGDIVHYDKIYPGAHEAIVDADLFDAVQARLAANVADRRAGRRASSGSLLAGMIRDASDRPLSPSHAVKAGKRYRYYVTNIAVPTDGPGRVLRLPALLIETGIVAALRQAIANLRVGNAELAQIGGSDIARIECAKAELVEHTKSSRTSMIRQLLLAIDLQIEVETDKIIASCCRRRLLERLDTGLDWSAVTGRVELRVTATVMHNGQELRLRIDPPIGEAAAASPQLMALVIRAHAARDLLATDGHAIPTDRKRELLRTARAAYLAPDIVTAIFEGRQPRTLNARTIDRIGRMPICWREQRRIFGFI